MSTLLDEFFDLAENSIESVVIESDGEESLYDDYPEDVIQEDDIIYDMITRTIIIPNNELSDIQKQKLQKIIDTLNNPVIIMTQDSLFNQIKIDNNAKVDDILPQLNDTVKESLMNEAKQVGPLYHATTLKGLTNILRTNTLKSHLEPGISFTRNKNFIYDNNPFILVFDGDKISENNITKPFDYAPFSQNTIKKHSEYETVVIPNKKNKINFTDRLNKGNTDLDLINNEEVHTLKDVSKYLTGLIINSDFVNDKDWDKTLNLSDIASLNTPQDVIERGKNLFKELYPELPITYTKETKKLATDQKMASNESVLDEGDKKVFDKRTGYNSSKDELYYFDLLKKKWPDIIMSYTDDRLVNPDTHRHFQMDYFVPSEDMAIQIMKHVKHGRRRYNPDDPNCQKDVRWLKSKAKPGNFYEKILHTWKDLDPLKIQLAKENGIKYVDIYNMDEFIKWYNNPELTYEEYKTAPESMQYDSDEYFTQKARGRDIYGNDSQPYAD